MNWSISVLVRLALSVVFLVPAGDQLANAPTRRRSLEDREDRA
jgi:hypothetical protein